MQVVKALPGGSRPEEADFASSGWYECFTYMRTRRRMSIMDILNFVVSLLNLLVNLLTGVIPLVWALAKDVFQDRKYEPKHFSDKK